MYDDSEAGIGGVRICTLACGDHGAHYTILVWAGYARMRTFLAGQSDRETQNALVCRATVDCSDDAYTLIAFGAEARPKAEKGVLSAKDFLHLLSSYKGYAGSKFDIYIIKHRSGALVSFQQRDDPFLSAFGL
jgi:hypothetical protein